MVKGKGTCSTCKFFDVSSLAVHFGATTTYPSSHSIYTTKGCRHRERSNHLLRSRVHRPRAPRPRHGIHILVYPQHARLLHLHLRRRGGRRRRRIQGTGPGSKQRDIRPMAEDAPTCSPSLSSSSSTSGGGGGGGVSPHAVVPPALSPLLVLLGQLLRAPPVPGLFLLALLGAAPPAEAAVPERGGPGQLAG